MKKLNILILFLIIYCGGGEIAEEPTTTTTSTTTSTSTTTTVPEIIDFDKLFFEDYFGVKWNKENITWRFAEERMITAYLEEEYSVIKPSINRINYTKKAFQVWGDAVNSINFKQSENSDNADITIGIVDNVPGRNVGFWESTVNENNEITYATIIIENSLGGTDFLTTILHEIGNVLGLGDISPRQDIRSIQEDPFQEDFVGSSLWEFDVQMIKQLYDE